MKERPLNFDFNDGEKVESAIILAVLTSLIYWL